MTAPVVDAPASLATAGKALVGLIGAGIQLPLTPPDARGGSRHHGLRLHYQLIDLDRTPGAHEHLPALLTAARIMGFAGLNITYPCKQLPLVAEREAQRALAGGGRAAFAAAAAAAGVDTEG